MGTSTHNIGQKGGTPLVPSWLEEDEGKKKIMPEKGDGNRFSAARGDLTRYISSGGRDISNARAGLSKYVRDSLGGSSNAAKRMGSANRSAARLLGGYGALAFGGVHEFERYFSLEDVSDRPISEVLSQLTDKICDDGGLIDQSIFRSAYIDALTDNPEIVDKTVAEMTPEMFLSIIKDAIANAVTGRITNDVFNKVVFYPDDVNKASQLEEQVEDFIHNCVADAFTKENINVNHLSGSDANSVITHVYERTFKFIELAGENE